MLLASAVCILALLLILSQSVFSGTTGKISGFVKDAETGDPLPGVNVYLEGTTFGAATDLDGYYFIINIPPGKYTVVSSMMGYRTHKLTDVRILNDLTTKHDFLLKPAILTGEEVTVTAERPLIQPDITGKSSTITADVIANMPVASTTEIFTMQSGVVQTEAFQNMIPGYGERGLEQVHVRGGRNAEVAFLIDGVKVDNLVFGGSATHLNTESVSELQIMTGGFSAEYGNAMSGVINMVTKEAGSNYRGMLEYNTGELGFESDRLRDFHEGKLTLSGPVPLIKNLGFFFSGSGHTNNHKVYEYDDILYDPDTTGVLPNIRYDDKNNEPGVGEWSDKQWDEDGIPIHRFDTWGGWHAFGWDDLYDGMFKLTYKLTDNFKIGLTDHRSVRDAKFFGDAYRYYDEEKNVMHETTTRNEIAITHQLSPNTYYDIRGVYNRYQRTMRSYAGEWRGEEYEGEELNNKAGGYNETTNPLGYRAWQNVAGFRNEISGDRYWTDHFDDTWTFKADLTSQIAKHHQIRTGLLYRHLTLDQEDYQILWYASPYAAVYVAQPQEFAAYFQDKIEYDFLVLNLGMRLDYNTSSTKVKLLKRDESGDLVLDENGNYIYEEQDLEFWEDPRDASSEFLSGEPRFQISPRIGVSHPVTKDSYVFFNYGHFFQNPIYRNLFLSTGNQGEISYQLGTGVPLLGNPNMSNEKTVQYEIGYKQAIANIWSFEVVAWSKDQGNMVGSERIPAFSDATVSNPYGYTVFLNYDYANSKGLDITIEKRPSNYFSGKISYTYSKSTGNRDDPWDGYRSGHTLETMPKRQIILGWDIPHQFNLNLDIVIPKKQGPTLFGSKVLQDIGLNILYRAASGRPYTPTTRDRALPVNSARMPATHNVDLFAYKKLDITKRFDMMLFAEVKNLLDRKNVYSVYSLTGSPTNPGPGYEQVESARYDRPHYFADLRKINLGLRFTF
jgi:outer membrane receptor protein involved in Fe transport